MKTKRRFTQTFHLLAPLLGAVAFMATAPRASAIQDGELDGEEHPYVCLVAAFDAAGNYMWRGSGTQISPSVVITAGHVVGIDAASGLEPAFMLVFFDSDLRISGNPNFGFPVPDPDWTGEFTLPNTHDIGAVILAAPVVRDTYGELPQLGIIDAMATQRGTQDTTFDIVGYGIQYIRQTPKGIIKLEADPVRYQGVASLVNTQSSFLDAYSFFISGDNGGGNGSGAIGFGDSGGPVFLPGTNIMVGISSFGLSMQATGPGGAYRTDTPGAQDFIYSVLDWVNE